MSNPPSYSVKQSGEMGKLKLKLTRDPRASRVKSPLRQSSLTEPSNKGADKTHPSTSPLASKAADTVTTNTQTSVTDTATSRVVSQAPVSSGSQDQIKTTKNVDRALLQSVLKHVIESPKKEVAVKKTHTQTSVKTGPSTSKAENTLLHSITQSYATLESFLSKSSLHKTKPIIPASSQATTKLQPAPAKSQVILGPHSTHSTAKPFNPLSTVVLSNPVKSTSYKPLTLITASTVKPSTTVAPPVAKPLKTVSPQSSKTVVAKPSISSATGKQPKSMASKPVAPSSAKRNPISPSSNSLPKAKKAKLQSVSLPASRVRTIMKTNVKSSQNSLNISQESVQVVGRATELFISELVKSAHKATLESAQNEVTYNHLARAVHKNPDEMRFLYDILPEKVKVKEYLASLQPRDNSTD